MKDETLDEVSTDALQDLLLTNGDIQEFLTELTRMIAEHLSDGQGDISCAVTLLRDRKAATVASSSAKAESLDEIQYSFGDGPCLTAAREHQLIHVKDMQLEARWPGYKDAAAESGIRSVLGVPFDLRTKTAAAALDVYSPTPNHYNDEAIEQVQREVRLASTAMRMAVRMAWYQDRHNNMEAAMGTRTNIDMAVGLIMGQNGCSQNEAINMLKSASSSRNIKLRDVAAGIITSAGQAPAQTHFES